jgi:hypothetical protein
MQTNLSRTPQAARTIDSPRCAQLADKPGRVLGVVDGLLSVTQQEWALGLAMKQSRRRSKVTQ